MDRKLTAILSADVKGYSRLMGEDEEATLHTLHLRDSRRTQPAPLTRPLQEQAGDNRGSP
jgi:adenylate cyclase